MSYTTNNNLYKTDAIIINDSEAFFDFEKFFKTSPKQLKLC